MLIINNFLHGIYNFVKSLSKKAYRTCAIIASGAAIIAVISMNSRGFDGNGKNNVTTANVQTQSASEDGGEEEGAEKKSLLSYEILALSSVEDVSSSPFTENESKEQEQLPLAVPEDKQLDVVTEAEKKVGTVYTDDNGNRLVVNNIGLTVTESDYEALKRIVEAEAGNQDDRGRILVANVVVNRVKDGRFPKSIHDVIFQKNGNVYQFQPTSNGTYYSVNVSEMTKECVDRALSGEDYSQGALYFTRRTSQYSWFNTSLTFLFIHGAHYFYK